MIKATLLKNIPLYNYNPNFETRVHSDASHFAAGACLSQIDPVSKQPCNPWWKSEEKWPIFHKEFAAAVYFIKNWRHMILGKRFTLVTDSKPLTSWKSMNPEGGLAKLDPSQSNPTGSEVLVMKLDSFRSACHENGLVSKSCS